MTTSPTPPEHQWTCNIDAQEVAGALREAARVVILTHSKPDGDAVGAAVAAARTLRLIGVEATPVFTGPWVHAFDEIIEDTPVLHSGVESIDAGALGDPDLVLIVDTGSWSQVADARSFLQIRAERTIVVDHHLQGDADIASRRLIDPTAPAACEIIARVCAHLLETDAPSLPRDVAEPLYLGLATDTGWFRHSNVTPRSMRLAGDLLEAGVRHPRIFQIVEQRDRVQRLLLMARALASLELHADERVALMTLTPDDFEACGAGPEDTGGFSDKPLAAESVLVGAMCIAFDDEQTKVSLRSKTGPDGRPSVDVNEVARALGGGGHAQAAGVKINAPIEEARRRLLSALLDTLR